jgi:hypothetical protein
MRNEPIANRFQWYTLIVTIVALFLCLTWTPAHGYCIARIDNATSQTGDLSGGEGSDLNLVASMSSSGVSSSQPDWLTNRPSAYDTYDETPSSYPPSVPEPGTMMLISIGLLGAAVYRRIRK